MWTWFLNLFRSKLGQVIYNFCKGEAFAVASSPEVQAAAKAAILGLIPAIVAGNISKNEAFTQALTQTATAAKDAAIQHVAIGVQMAYDDLTAQGEIAKATAAAQTVTSAPGGQP